MCADFRTLSPEEIARLVRSKRPRFVLLRVGWTPSLTLDEGLVEGLTARHPRTTTFVSTIGGSTEWLGSLAKPPPADPARPRSAVEHFVAAIGPTKTSGRYHLFADGYYIGFEDPKKEPVRPDGILLGAELVIALLANNHDVFGRSLRQHQAWERDEITRLTDVFSKNITDWLLRKTATRASQVSAKNAGPDKALLAYKRLGLEPGATPDAISQAYRKLAKQCHPDRLASVANLDPEVVKFAERRFTELKEAYDLLAADGACDSPS